MKIKASMNQYKHAAKFSLYAPIPVDKWHVWFHISDYAVLWQTGNERKIQFEWKICLQQNLNPHQAALEISSSALTAWPSYSKSFLFATTRSQSFILDNFLSGIVLALSMVCWSSIQSHLLLKISSQFSHGICLNLKLIFWKSYNDRFILFVPWHLRSW